MIDDLHLEDIQVTESSGNVFADLGLLNAEEALAKADLAIAINHIMEARGLTERETVGILDASQSLIHDVRRGRLTDVSTHWLRQAGKRLGMGL